MFKQLTRLLYSRLVTLVCSSYLNEFCVRNRVSSSMDCSCANFLLLKWVLKTSKQKLYANLHKAMIVNSILDTNMDIFSMMLLTFLNYFWWDRTLCWQSVVNLLFPLVIYWYRTWVLDNICSCRHFCSIQITQTWWWRVQSNRPLNTEVCVWLVNFYFFSSKLVWDSYH